MKRLLLALLASGALLLLSPAFASQAMAATTTTAPAINDQLNGPCRCRRACTCCCRRMA